MPSKRCIHRRICCIMSRIPAPVCLMAVVFWARRRYLMKRIASYVVTSRDDVFDEIMLFIIENDCSTRGPVKMDRHAVTTFSTEGYLLSLKTELHHTSRSTPSAATMSTSACMSIISLLKPGASMVGKKSGSFFKRIPVSVWPKAKGSRRDSVDRTVLLKGNFFCIYFAVEMNEL
ncbi:hypothetical protein EGW08_010596 [Elysia chlorotica]|uniref:Uncharacterized protein n=1 Tax=Elysia chlorotica TaxID=188477 RepID=A0A433TJ92_ELYCH|nr:hypothetical protein EGW08_010596 [Elysia chlorotica]